MIISNKHHQENFLTKVKSRTQPETFQIENLSFEVIPGVFPPATDTKLLARNVHVKPNETILDLTAGSGVIAIIAALQGSTVTAVDINPAALKNIQINCLKHKVKVTLIQSDLFQKLKSQKFNQIFLNGPFYEGKIKDPIDYACYGAKDFYQRFFSQFRLHLKPKGQCLMVIQANPTMVFIPKLLSQKAINWQIIDDIYSGDGQRLYQLYKLN